MTAVHLNSVPPEQTPILLHRLDIETLPRRILHTPDFVAASLSVTTLTVPSPVLTALGSKLH